MLWLRVKMAVGGEMKGKKIEPVILTLFLECDLGMS